jgi:hypothetical protein
MSTLCSRVLNGRVNRHNASVLESENSNDVINQIRASSKINALRTLTSSNVFDVHVTVRRDKFLTIKSTTCTNFSNLFVEWNSTCFGQFLCPSSGVFHCTHNSGIHHICLLTAARSCQKTCMTYTTAVCTVKNSWWWTEELSETCRVSFYE